MLKRFQQIKRALRFPDSQGLLAQLNLPDDVIASVIGKTVTVSVFPEEKAMTRKIDDPTHEDSPFLIDVPRPHLTPAVSTCYPIYPELWMEYLISFFQTFMPARAPPIAAARPHPQLEFDMESADSAA